MAIEQHSKRVIDCENTDRIVCPYCGYRFMESYEYDCESTQRIECERCDEPFDATSTTTIKYTSSKVTA